MQADITVSVTKKLSNMKRIGMVAKLALVAVCCVGAFSLAYSQDAYKGREQWVKLSPAEQRAMFQKMSGEDKVKLWNDKFEETEGLDWSAAELKHIGKLKKFISDNATSLFVDKENNEKALKSLQEFSEKWMNEGKKKFNWSKELMFHIAADTGELTNEMLKQLRQ